MAEISRVLLDPKAKLTSSIVGYLSKKIRTAPSGARSLAHILVVTPTAQSSRRLRETLAREYGAVVPPVFKVASHLVEIDEDSVATPVQELVAMREAKGPATSFDLAAQLVEIRRIIGANAYDMADVANMAKDGSLFKGDMADVEIERWEMLADLEKRYYLALQRFGRIDRTVAVKRALENGVSFDGVEEIVIAAVMEPLPVMSRVLDMVSLPVVELVTDLPDDGFSSLAFDDIVPCRTVGEEARRIAGIFGEVSPNEALPAVCVADKSIFAEVQGAIGAKGVKVIDPAEAPLTSSSLGIVVMQLAALVRTRSYDVFSAFIRTGDARRWLKASIENMDDAKYTAAIIDLDNRQRQLIPATIDDIAPKTKGALRAIFELVLTSLRKKDLRGFVRSVYSSYILDESDPRAREFAAAAKAIADLMQECFSVGLDEKLALDLFVRRLSDSTYSLESDEGADAVVDGWLELPYLSAEELYIAGFQEGIVPQSIAGHAFVPDSLRVALGLPNNASREKRDLAILNLILACRQKGAVKVFFHSLDAQGNVVKPSRLLFACRDNADFVNRVEKFYSDETGTKEFMPASLPEAWKLSLPLPPKEIVFTEKSSPSALDAYMKCPFTYYLKKIYTEGEEYGNEELDAAEFGHLVHDALEKWAKGEFKDSSDAAAISAALSENIDSILKERFGDEIPAIVSLQGESAKRRLACFAACQVKWREAGWRIVESEGKLEYSLLRENGSTRITGRSDRIDYNDITGRWCVIDYKTWDTADRATAYDARNNTWNSLQLPLYCAMLDADNGTFAAAKRDMIDAVYCIIGKTPEDVKYSEPISGALVPDAEAKVKELLSGMDRGVFWPPGEKKSGRRADWEFHFSDWIAGTPADGVSAEWIADQERRLRS